MHIMIIMIFGLPGSGKSYFARHLQKEIDAIYFNTDIIRRELNLNGVYNEESKQKVYDKLVEEVSGQLDKGFDVIVDGTFHKQRRRESFRGIARKKSIEIYFIEIKASERTIRKRIEKKRKDSEADFEVYRNIKNEFDPFSESHLILRSDKESINDMIIKTKKYIYKSP